MKSAKHLFLLLITFFSLKISICQENYQPGYIITNDNDTISGQIDYRNWIENPKKIKFEFQDKMQVETYTPNTIKEFGVADEIYSSGIVETSTSSPEVNQLDENPELNLRIDTAFLQTIYQGEKNLYFYKNSQGIDGFYLKKDDEYELLVFKRYIWNDDGIKVKTENKKFLGQLKLYLSDCPTINSQLENTTYKLYSLRELFQYYFDCTGSNLTYSKKKDKGKFELGILGGATLTSLKFNGEDQFDYLIDSKFSQSTDFSGGVFFNFIFPRNQGKWSINNDILYSSYTVENTFRDDISQNIYEISQSEIGFSYIKLNNSLQYKFPIGDMDLFLKGGISNGISINETNKRTIENVSYSVSRKREELALDQFRKYEQGFMLGTGLNLNRLTLDLRMERGNGMSKYSELGSTTQRLYLLLGYQLNNSVKD